MISYIDKVTRLSNQDVANLRKRILEALMNVYDPEIPVNVVDLGLIYDITISDDLVVTIKYTLTAPGCPIAPLIEAQIIEAVKNAVPEAKDVRAELVFDPPWTPLRITREGREQLKVFYGYDIVEAWLRRSGQA